MLTGEWTLQVKSQFLVLPCGQKLHEGKILETDTEIVQRSISSLEASLIIPKLGVQIPV